MFRRESQFQFTWFFQGYSLVLPQKQPILKWVCSLFRPFIKLYKVDIIILLTILIQLSC